MALRAGTAYVDIAAKVAPGFSADVERGITPGMDSAGKKAGGVLSSSFGKAAAVAGGAVLAAKAKDFLSGAVEAARESARVAAQSEQVIKSTGGAANITADAMGDLAGSIAKVTGVDDEAIQSAENLLATFTNVSNGVGKGNKVFDQATKTIVDMSAVQGTLEGNALMLGKALQDPIKGIGALKRVGVDLNPVQEETIRKMVEMGDTAGAQKVILAELGKEFGGQAEAQSTAAGRLSVAWGNVQESIGEKLLPVLEKVSGFLADHSELILPLAGVISGVLVVAFTAWAISAASAAVATIAAAAPVLAVIAVVGALGAAIFLLVKNWSDVWAKIKEVVGAGVDWVVGKFRGIVSGIGSAMTGVADLITAPYRLAFNAIAKLWNNTVGKLKFKIPGWVPGVGGKGFDVPNIPEFRAEGGPVSSSRPYIVGERGPELFVPRVSGGIMPNALLEGLGPSNDRGGFHTGPITVQAIARDDPWYVGSTLNRTLRELAYAEGWG